MISLSPAKGGESLHTVVVVAFDKTSGEVHGTYAHGSLDRPDTDGAMRGGERLREQIAVRKARSPNTISLVELALTDIPPTGIARIDPETRRPVAIRDSMKFRVPETP
jgi:hypothetical protein